MGPLEVGGVRSANKEAAAGAEGEPVQPSVLGKTSVRKTARLLMVGKMVAEPGKKQSLLGQNTEGLVVAKTICRTGMT